jgi:uncharacterized protein YeeX (DUF496 family)
MSVEPYIEIANKHLSDCKRYGISIEDATFEIMHMAEDYSDEEIKSTFNLLPSEVVKIAHNKLDDYKKTGEYYVISSTGITKELTKLMKRLSMLI